MPLINCSRGARQWPLPACECTERDAIVKFRPLFSEFLRRKSILTPHFKLPRSEEHTSELQSLMRISYAVFCLKKKKKIIHQTNPNNSIINSESTKHCNTNIT